MIRSFIFLVLLAGIAGCHPKDPLIPLPSKAIRAYVAQSFADGET